MKKIGIVLGIKLGLAIFCATVALTAPVFAEDAKPAGLNPDDLKKALGMSIYLQAGYTYNGNASSETGVAGGPGSENNLRVYDHKANSFGLDLAEIIFLKDTSPGAIGYKVKISAGETAKLIHAAGLGDTGQDAIDFTEAYVSYTAALGKGLRFDIGKMMTFVGAEVMEAIDNPNYSRSFLYNYAEPLTHTGVKASYIFSDNVNAALFVVNGWDNATDNNTGKSVGVSVNVSAGDPFSAYINYLQGPEQADNNHDSRSLLDLVATIKPIKPLSIILNYDAGQEDHLSASGGTAKWSGIAGIVKYDINDTYSVAVRAESFDDKDGVRTGTEQKLTEETVTLDVRLNGGIIVRPEYRHDSSDKESFDNGTKKSQDTLALSVMYRW
jgi:hypothetical protein